MRLLLIGATGGVRGSIGASEIVEALSDPEKAKNFGTRIRDLFRDGDINDWVGALWFADMPLVSKELGSNNQNWNLIGPEK